MSQGTSTGTVGTGTGGTTGASVGLAPQAYNQVAPLTTQQQAAQQLVSNLSQPVQNYLGSQLGSNQFMGSGALMSPYSNPYLSQMYNAAAVPLINQYQQATAPNILQQGAQSGTLGSSGYAQNFLDAQSTLGANLGDLAANLYGNAYNTGLQGTLTAQQMTPSMATAQYTPAQQLFSSGQLGQKQAQNILDTTTGNLNQQANWPANAVNLLAGGLQQLGGQQTTFAGNAPNATGGK